MSQHHTGPRSGKEFQLTGKHVFAMLAAFFGVVFAVNGVLIYQSQKSWTGLEPGNGYEASRKFNKQAAEARALLRKGWKTKLVVPPDGRLVIELRDADGLPLGGMRATAQVRHRVGLKGDRRLTFSPRGHGRYVADEPLPPGAWRIQARFTRDGRLQWLSEAEFVIWERR